MFFISAFEMSKKYLVWPVDRMVPLKVITVSFENYLMRKLNNSIYSKLGNLTSSVHRH